MMNLRIYLTTAFLLAAATGASAQSSEAAPAAQPLGGPVVPGVCLLSREATFANALVGKAASAQLAELTRAAQTEIDRQRTLLETDAKALEGQPDNAQLKQRRDALGERWQALRLQAAHDSREIEATRAKAQDRIATEAQPVIAQVYGQKKCGLLFDRNSALGGNFANDLTAEVVLGLDARIQAMSFERERLPREPARADPADTGA